MICPKCHQLRYKGAWSAGQWKSREPESRYVNCCKMCSNDNFLPTPALLREALEIMSLGLFYSKVFFFWFKLFGSFTCLGVICHYLVDQCWGKTSPTFQPYNPSMWMNGLRTSVAFLLEFAKCWATMGPADSWPFFFKCKGWEDQEELGSSRRAAKPRALWVLWNLITDEWFPM